MPRNLTFPTASFWRLARAVGITDALFNDFISLSSFPAGQTEKAPSEDQDRLRSVLSFLQGKITMGQELRLGCPAGF
jgi:hypothetical protein